MWFQQVIFVIVVVTKQIWIQFLDYLRLAAFCWLTQSLPFLKKEENNPHRGKT